MALSAKFKIDIKYSDDDAGFDDANESMNIEDPEDPNKPLEI
ncbi:MAG: hypothetical protein ACI8QT_001215 [Halioglobus sp.]|jgi:hypothetical protein